MTTRSPFFRLLSGVFASALLLSSAQAQSVQTNWPAAWQKAKHKHDPKPSQTPIQKPNAGDPDGVWTANASGNWSTPGNWSGGTIADGGGKADFSTININGNRIVTIDTTSRTVREIDIGDIDTNRSYTIAAGGGANLIFDNTANSADAILNQTSTSNGDLISAPVVINSSLDITNASANLLTISGAITAGTAGVKTITGSTGAVTLSGNIGDGSGTVAITQNGSGTLTLSGANTYTGGTTINAGTVKAGSATALAAGALTFGAGSTGKFQLSGRNITVSDLNTDATVGTPIVENGVAGANTLTVKTTNADVYAGVLQDGAAGTLALIKSSSGSLTLLGNNTYSGGTTLTAGSVIASGNSSLGSGTIGFNGGTLQDNGSALTFSNQAAISSNGGTVAGSNAISINGAWSQSASSILTITNSAGVTIGGDFDLDNSATARTLTINGAGNLTMTGSLKNTGTAVGSLTYSGSGVLTLSGPNTYGGTTTLSSGTINVNSSTAFGASTSVAINGVTLDNTSGNALTLVNNNPMTWGGNNIFTGSNDLNLGTGAVTLTGSRTWTINAGMLTVGGAIGESGGARSLTKNGNGALALGGASSYTGGTTLSSGTLDINNVQALGTGTFVISAGTTIDNTSGNAITLANNAQTWNGSGFTFTGTNDLNLGTGAVTLSGGAATRTITVTNGTLTVGGVISNGTGNAIAKAGSGALTLTGANQYSGGTTISAGTLNISNAAAISTGTLTVTANSTIGNTSGTTITLTNSNSINLTGGTLTFAGPNDLSFGNNAVTMTGGNRTIAVGSNDTLTIGSITEDTPSRNFQKNGNGNLILIGASTYTGTTSITNGTMQLGNGGTTGSLSTSSAITDNANLTFNRSNAVVQGTDFSGASINGAGSVTQAGSGSLTLNTANGYNGGTTLSLGTLVVGDNSALGTGIFTFSGGTLTTTGGPISLANNVTLNANGTIAGANDLTFTGSFSETGNDRTLTVTNSGTTNFGAVNLSGNNTAHTLTVTGTGNTVFNGVIANPGMGASGLTFDNSYTGTATLNGSNTYSGTTTLNNGTFVLGNKAAFGTGGVASNGVGLSANTNLTGANAIANNINLNNTNTFGGTNSIELSGTLTNTDNAGVIRNTMSSGALTLSGILNISNNTNARTLTFSGTGNTLVSGVIQDGNATPENIQKNNNGALRLTNTNTYTGTTTIAAGTVDLNTTATTVGRLAGTSNVTVNSNGTLMLSDTGGSGSADRINDAATMTLNGGTFTTGGLSEHGATNNTAGIGALTLQSNSVLNLGNGASVIAFANSSAQAWAASITLSIFNWTGSPGGGGTDQVYFGNDNTGLTASQLAEINFFSDNGLTPLGVAQILGNGEIVPVAVPEPGTWVAGGLVCLALVKTARRRSSSAA